MNRQRRKDLLDVIIILEKLKSPGNKPSYQDFENLARLVQSSCDEENDALFNMPENLRFSDRYADIEYNVYDLEEAVSRINDAAECAKAGREVNGIIEDAIKSITEAIDR